MKNLIFAAIVSFQAFSLFAADVIPDEQLKAFNELKRESQGTFTLPQSHSKIKIPRNHELILGQDAKKYDTICGNFFNDAVEAVLLPQDDNGEVFFENYTDGYVSLDDWNIVDAAAMLRELSESTEYHNKERVKRGLPEMHVIGWCKEPTLDSETKTVYWAIDLQSGTNTFVNSVALRLNRFGYEKLIWVTSKPIFLSHNELQLALKSHHFEKGFRYEDYMHGDKIAQYGIATLVAATIGSKVIKAGLLTGLFLFCKKFAFMIIAAIVALFYKLKAFFKPKPERV